MKSVNRQSRVARHIESALGQALGGLAGKDFSVTAAAAGGGTAPDPPEAFIWQQGFSVVAQPALWLAAGRDLWEPLGRMVLEAAGVDDATEEDSRSTWQEIVNQTMAGVASAITADLLREVTSSGGEELKAEQLESTPLNLTWLTFSITDGSGQSWSCQASWSRELAEVCEPLPEETRTRNGRESSLSRTLDLLLDVSLPVNVSFGKTALQIREVLKLNTGSIVELNRYVTDPVEVIVNDCVIARGEVVVVDGNYGVRIKQLASREDRLRTGIADAPGRIGAKP